MNSFPTLKMLVGIPGSGKTTYCKDFMLLHPDTVHISSDSIRQELFNDENDQTHNEIVFQEMHKRTLESLDKGNTVLYDATNINRKDRESLLRLCPSYVIKEAIVCWAPIEQCVLNDGKRERTVGKTVIDKMLMKFQSPYFDEGFDRIYINRTAFDRFGYQTYYLDTDISQDNPHHHLTLQTHQQRATEYISTISNDSTLRMSARIHDLGKLHTKSFLNTKGEKTGTAHFYGHAGYSGWISYGIECDNNTKLAWLVSNHMDIYGNTKYYRRLPEFLKVELSMLYEADRYAH